MKLVIPSHIKFAMLTARTRSTHVWLSNEVTAEIVVKPANGDSVVLLTPRGAESSTAAWDNTGEN